MILQCPECNAKFKIPDGALGEKGREVKCGKCAHLWHAMPEAVPEPVPKMEELEEKPKEKPKKKEKAPDIDKVLAGKKHKSQPDLAALGSYKPPKKIKSSKKFWFAMGTAYLIFGFATAGLWSITNSPEKWGFIGSGGFAFERIELIPVKHLGGERFTMNPVFKISGTLRNTSGNAKVVPLIQVSLLDNEGNVVYKRKLEDKTSVPPGETQDFLLEDLEQATPAYTHFAVEMGNELELALRVVEPGDEN